jgi:hypothetical protein
MTDKQAMNNPPPLPGTELPATVEPAWDGARWQLTFGQTTLQVDPGVAGRITGYRLGVDQALTGPDVHPDNYGSSFWTSPQAAWGWPPPAEIDTACYEAATEGNVLVLSGPTVASGGIQGLSITKRIAANAEAAAVCLEYQIHNHGNRARDVAAWEITRVPRANLHFFPEGPAGEVKKFQDLLPLASAGQVAWLQYDAARMDRDLLVGRHGSEGWLASVREDLLFIKRFPVVAPDRAAPGEAGILLFLSGESSYVELEPQSQSVPLPPRATLRWAVQWRLRRLPAALARTCGSTELVEFVRSVLGH